MHLKKINHRGFSLIELMVAMAIAMIVLAAIHQAYLSQQKAYTSQQLVVEMQQNARAAMTLMKREIRMAGFAPAAKDGQDNDGDTNIDEADGDYPAGRPGFVVAESNEIQFTRDTLPDPEFCADGVDNDIDTAIDEFDECFSNGNTAGFNEDITYSLSGTTLMRDDTNDSSPPQVLAYDIEAVAFGYSADILPLPDGDGELDSDPLQPDNFRFWPIVPAPRIGTIGAVKIWLLARTAHPIKDYSDPTLSYQVGDQTIVPADRSYKRTLQIATVYCRN